MPKLGRVGLPGEICASLSNRDWLHGTGYRVHCEAVRGPAVTRSQESIPIDTLIGKYAQVAVLPARSPALRADAPPFHSSAKILKAGSLLSAPVLQGWLQRKLCSTKPRGPFQINTEPQLGRYVLIIRDLRGRVICSQNRLLYFR